MIIRVTVFGIPVGARFGNEKFSPSQAAASNAANSKMRRAAAFNPKAIVLMFLSCRFVEQVDILKLATIFYIVMFKNQESLCKKADDPRAIAFAFKTLKTDRLS